MSVQRNALDMPTPGAMSGMHPATSPYATSQPVGDGRGATEVAGGVPVAPVTRKAAREAHSPREQWKFTGRETLGGRYEFLIWTRQDGKRFARWVR